MPASTDSVDERALRQLSYSRPVCMCEGRSILVASAPNDTTQPSTASPAMAADHDAVTLRPPTLRRPARYYYTADAAYHPLRLTVHLHHWTNMAAAKKGHVLRVTGLAASHPDDELAASLEAAINDDLTDQEKAKMGT